MIDKAYWSKIAEEWKKKDDGILIPNRIQAVHLVSILMQFRLIVLQMMKSTIFYQIWD